MAAKTRTKKAQPKSAASKNTARVLVDEVEKAGESLLREIKDGFATITDKVSVAAQSAAEGIADTTSSMADRISKTQTFKSALDQIESVGERVINVLGERFETLKNRVVASSKSVAKKKPAAKTASTAKKAAKKKTVVKKAPLKKAAKKKATKKKASKKAAAKK